MNIEFKEGAVCFAGNRQWHFNESVKPYRLVSNMQGTCLETYKGALSFGDFQLNEIKQGDYIPVSELDTEQKYNNAVKVFGLLGFFKINNLVNEQNYMHSPFSALLAFNGDQLLHVKKDYFDNKRKITLNQLMAIGELKRMMNERDNAVLNSSEETELKSSAMASELNSESNDEWPKIGDEVEFKQNKWSYIVVARHENSVWLKNVITGAPTGALISYLKKPKLKEDLLIEELQAKLVENNAVDNWMLAANIINGDIEGLTYKGDSDD